jgi:hypothetical protein
MWPYASRLCGLCAVCFALLCCVSSARAQKAWATEEPCIPERVDGLRTLNGHAFMPFNSIPWPFVTTRVGSATAAGLMRLESVPVVNLGLVSSNALLASFQQSFDLDIALARFMAVNVALSFGNAVGVNESGAFNLGLNYAAGGALGVIFRLAHGKRWYLSVRVDGARLRAEAVLPVALTETATVDENGNVTFDIGALTRGGSVSRGAVNLMAAFAPVRWLGLQATLGFQTTRSTVEESSNHVETMRFGLGSTWRFNDVGVPLALMFGGSMRVRINNDQRLFYSTVESASSFTGTVEPGIFYSNPRYIDVGLLMAFQLSSKDRRSVAQITLNHFW